MPGSMADEGDDECGFNINEAYAENYNKWRQKEELQKLKDKYGDIDDESSSSSESEDENAEALTEGVEHDWLRTLSALKNKDPRIYRKDTQFYRNESVASGEGNAPKKKGDKPLYISDYERKTILEKRDFVNEEIEDEVADKPGYFEEQNKIKESFRNVLDSLDAELSDSDFLHKRKKTKVEEKNEESEYIQWLKGQKTELKEREVGIELEPLKNFWFDPKLDVGEKFLRDYILNKRYIDKDEDRIPTYDEIVDDGQGFAEEENLLDKQEDFERKYNFRYEEPDPEFIKSYPRTIESSLRRKDNKRAKKRDEIKERKKQEKEKKKEELKHLKNLKKQEILDKINTLKEITGNSFIGFTEDDVEGDFDPAQHNEMMHKYFDDDYYGEDVDEIKPEYTGNNEDIQAENWDNWQGEDCEKWYTQEEELHVDDPNFSMDADDYLTQVKPSSKKKRKKSVFYETLTKKKPVFDPKERTFEEYLDEFYRLDYEDIIGDMPCRFRYRKVVANSYGLSVDEILKCRDKELNSWVSVKKMSQYRTTEEETRDVHIYKAKSRNERKKKNILASLKEGKDDTKESKIENISKPGLHQESKGEVAKTEFKRKCKISKSNQKSTENSEANSNILKPESLFESAQTMPALKHVSDTTGVNKRKKKQKHLEENKRKKVQDLHVTKADRVDVKEHRMNPNGKKKNNGNRKTKNQKPKISDERLQAYGINPRKFKYMKMSGHNM